MTYTSPFKLLPSINVDDKQINYSLLRRKLLAEFELNDDQPLEVNGITVGKTEALRIIEELKDEEFLKQHLEIFNNQHLLSFLEGRSTDYLLNSGNYNNNIPEVVQEAFVELLNKELVKTYRKSDDQLLKKLMLFPVAELIGENLGVSIYERFYKAAKSDLLELEEILELDIIAEKLKRLKQSKDIYSEDRAKCINFLPQEFSHLIDDYSVVSINLSVGIYRGRGDKKIPLKLCLFVSSLDTTDENLELAADNFIIIDKHGVVSGQVIFKKCLAGVFGLLSFMFLAYTIFDINNSDEQEEPNKQETLDPWADILTYASNTISRSDSSEYRNINSVSGKMANTTHYGQYSIGKQQVSFQNFSNKDVVIGVIVNEEKEPKQNSGELTHGWYLVKHNSSLTIETDTINDGLIAVVGDKWFLSDKGFLFNYTEQEGCDYIIEPDKDGYFYGDVGFFFLDSSSFIKKDSILICTIE